MSRIVKRWHSTVDENNKITINSGSAMSKQLGNTQQEPFQDTMSTVPSVDIGEIRKQAEEIITNTKITAQIEADSIIKKANDKALLIKEAAVSQSEQEANELKNKAYEEAYEEAINNAKSEADNIIKEAEKFKLQADDYKQELIKNIEPEIIELIVSILDNLIEVEKDINPDLISILIKNGLNKSSTTGDIIVHISEADYPRINKQMILSSMDEMANVSFVKDPTLKKSACIIETPLGNVDCGLDTQYSSLRRNLNYILKNS